MSLVIDASATLAWIYADERTEAVERVFQDVIVSGAWAPAIWPLEVANALEQSVRRSRIDAAYRNGALSDLDGMPITIDPETNKFAWTDTLVLAERFRLSLYDACYLELARRRNLPLATLDKTLREAGSALGIKVFGG